MCLQIFHLSNNNHQQKAWDRLTGTKRAQTDPSDLDDAAGR